MSMSTAMKIAVLFGSQRARLARQLAAMFADGSPQGWWWDLVDRATLFQDAALTLPVVSSGDPVRVVLDKSGRGNHLVAPSDAARPIYTVADGQAFLAPNGSSMRMETSAIDLSATNRITVTSGLRKASDAALGMLMEFGPPTTNGSFYLYAPAGASATYAWRSGGTSLQQIATPASYPAGSDHVVTGIGGIALDTSIIRVNGAQVGSSAVDQGTGNYGNLALYLFSRSTPANYFGGRFYGSIGNARSSGVTAAEMAAMEQYINLNARVTLA